MTAAVTRAAAVLVVRRGAPPKVDLAHGGAGLTVAVNRGGHLERVARRTLPRATIRTVDDNRKLPEILASGSVDGIVTDTAEMRAFDLTEAQVATVLGRDRKAYWVRPGDAALAADLDAWLLAREADGTLPKLRAKYGIDPPTATAAGALPEPTVRVVDLAGRRLRLMPLVAEAKRASGAPVEDAAREAVVVAAARSSACAAGLDPETYAALALAQIEAAKAVQRAVLAGPPGSGGPTLDLGRDLRPAIDRTDASLRAELARAVPLQASPQALAVALRADAAVPGSDGPEIAELARALGELRRATPGDCA
jgi:cyclohexadienyl dehydratase